MPDELHPDHDLAEGFPEYRPRPKDVVPRQIPDDLPPIPIGPQSYTNTEFDDAGVTRTEGNAWIGPAIYPKEHTGND